MRRVEAEEGTAVTRAKADPRHGPFIVESIVTTMSPEHAVNIAPMGVEWGEETIVLPLVDHPPKVDMLVVAVIPGDLPHGDDGKVVI